MHLSVEAQTGQDHFGWNFGRLHGLKQVRSATRHRGKQEKKRSKDQEEEGHVHGEVMEEAMEDHEDHHMTEEWSSETDDCQTAECLTDSYESDEDESGDYPINQGRKDSRGEPQRDQYISPRSERPTRVLQRHFFNKTAREKFYGRL